MKRRLWNLVVALDQFLACVFTLGDAWPDETFSGYIWRKSVRGSVVAEWFRVVIDWMFAPFEADHCRKVYEREVARGHLPPMMRG